ncbi:PRD domain-containing protein [Pontibacillus yanchengensis]|uniref:PRD domain-containing protein n=1 Tax=Pontibacillus yanchengensis TaxID=462910 RepID=A0ACC7VGD8_9BACI|nr:PRD domain-containing protein [Pontibacillus yanchengensis]
MEGLDNMTLDHRRTYILSQLHEAQQPVSVEWFTSKMGVSQRTVYYDVEHINDWLEDAHYEPITRERGVGFFLPTSTREALPEEFIINESWQYKFSQEEREILLILHVLTHYEKSTMKHFMDWTQMSRSTIVHDLKQIEETLAQYDLSLHYQKKTGYALAGSEFDRQNALSGVLSSILSNEQWVQVRNVFEEMVQQQAPQTDELLPFIKEQLYQTEQSLGLVFTDETMEHLAYQIALILTEQPTKQHIEMDLTQQDIIQQTNAFEAICELNQQLENADYPTLSNDEQRYVTLQILSSKVEYDDFSTAPTNEISQLREAINKIIDDFQIYSCILFDDRDQLEENLLTHIKPTYYRLKYGVTIQNDLLDYIKEHYQEVFQLTKKSMVHLETLIGRSLPDEEVAFIAIHFGGWLRKQEQSLNPKYRAIIVCESGVGTSNMLRSQLESLLHDLEITKTMSYREFKETTHNADVIFATNYIKQNETPVINVPALLTDVDKRFVINQLDSILTPKQQETSNTDELINMIQQYATVHDEQALRNELDKYQVTHTLKEKENISPMLDELLTEDTIQFEQSITDWEQAIRQASQPLIHSGKITEDYVQAMIDNVYEHGPYIVIAPQIAIPHARPEAGVEKLGMSFLRVQEPVHFSEQEKHRANLIIVLAAIDNETHLQALSQLTTMLSEPENLEHLIQTNDSEEVINLVKQYSTH